MADTNTIFALRKQGEIQQAFELAIEVYNQFPDDEWVNRAYCWTLFDKAKEALNAQNPEAAKEFIETFDSLKISDSENILHENFNRLRELAEPGHIELKKAETLDKEGKFVEAHGIFQTLTASLSSNPHFNESSAWNLYKYTKSLEDNIPINLEVLINLFEEYQNTKNARPSALHSRMLNLATKLAKEETFDYLKFLKNWNLNNLSEEDFTPFKFEGKDYPSLAEKALSSMSKRLMKISDQLVIESFLPHLDRGINQITQNIWLPYYKAKVLIQLNRHKEAESFLIPVVKEKRNEFWAWALLGEIYSLTSQSKAISCFCRALICPAEEKFLINVRSDFADLLFKNGHYDEAKTEFTLSIKSRQENGYKISVELQKVEQQEWFQKALLLDNNKKFYLNNNNEANEIIFSELPWLNACIAESFPSKKDPKTVLRKIYFSENGLIEEFVIKDKLFKISQGFRTGAPVQIKAEREDARWKIYLLEVRSEGKDWDLFPENTGIIDHVNLEKKVVHFLLSKTINGVIPFDKLSFSSPAIGDFLSIHYRLKVHDGRKTTVSIR